MPPIIGYALRYVFTKTIFDSESRGRFLGIFLVVLLGALFLISMPSIVVMNFPFLNMTDHLEGYSDLMPELVKIYKTVPKEIREKENEWVDQKKEQYSFCDEFDIEFDVSIDWRDLEALHATKIQQSYRQYQDAMDQAQTDITDVGNQFIEHKAYWYQYTVRHRDKDGTTWTEIRKRGVIHVTTKTFDQTGRDMGFKDVGMYVATNIRDSLYNGIFDTDLGPAIDIGTLKFLPGGARVPYFNQADSRWGNLPYGRTGTVREAGCGPTSLAMVVVGLTGRTDVNPGMMAQWSYQHGYRVEGSGSSWSLMSSGAQQFGLKSQQVSTRDAQAVLDALASGKPVIASMGPGHFTSEGHFMVLRGVTSDGKIMVNDPGSMARTNQVWDFSIILNEVKGFWIMSV